MSEENFEIKKTIMERNTKIIVALIGLVGIIVGGIFGLDHEFEDIMVEVVDLKQAEIWLQDGTINSAASIIALQWLLLNRDRLRQQWT